MRKVLVGVVLAAGLAGCSGGGDAVAVSPDEAAFYTEYCSHFVSCSDFPADISQSDCEEYFSELGMASMLSDPAETASCMYDAPICGYSSCLPDDVDVQCSSATVIEQCRGGACIFEDCRNWCGFTGYTGGSCVDDAGEAGCACGQVYSRG